MKYVHICCKPDMITKFQKYNEQSSMDKSSKRIGSKMDDKENTFYSL